MFVSRTRIALSATTSQPFRLSVTLINIQRITIAISFHICWPDSSNRIRSDSTRLDPMRSVEITSPSHTDFYADFDPIEPQQVASPLIRNVMRQLNCLSPALCRFSCCCCCCCCWSTHAMRSHKALSYLWGKSCLLWITTQTQVYLLSYSLKWSSHWVKRSLYL